jgi:RNase P/RNase MRP subunit p30
VWPTDREIRLRFILFAVIDAASVEGVPAELLLPAHKLLRDSPTEAQLVEAIRQILAADEMYGFRFPVGSEADDLMQTLDKPAG